MAPRYYLEHTGVSVRDGSPGRGNGRYALGSGNRPFQRIKTKIKSDLQSAKAVVKVYGPGMVRNYPRVFGRMALSAAISIPLYFAGQAILQSLGLPSSGSLLGKQLRDAYNESSIKISDVEKLFSEGSIPLRIIKESRKMSDMRKIYRSKLQKSLIRNI